MFPGFTVMLENLHKAVSGKLHNNSQQSSDKRNSNLKQCKKITLHLRDKYHITCVQPCIMHTPQDVINIFL